ncbi:MAG TPA: phosphoenolpyruvate--protein phosphotransferase [Streptosporangiales bacterium]
MTVGIVLVSHSAALARGTAELAREMAGDVAVEPAGGLDEPGEPLGTDAVRVADAVGRAASGDGVLVLMDLGSAVLSAETALDLVDDVEVRLTAAPLVEGAVAAAVAAQAGQPLDAVAAEARRGLAAKQAQLQEQAAEDEPADAAASPETVDWQRVELDVTNPLGLHGRPAARVVRAVSQFDAEVRITDLTNGHGPVSARSLASLMALGTVGGHRVEVSASGGQATEALDALRSLAGTGFGDDETAAPVAERPVTSPRAVPAADAEATIQGLPAAPGSVLGPVRHLRLAEVSRPETPRGSPAEERRRLTEAVHAVRGALEAAQRDLARASGEQAADVLTVQVLLVEDEALLGRALALVDGGAAAWDAWQQTVGELVSEQRRVGDEYQRARVEDIEDVGRRVTAALAGVRAAQVVSGEGVVVTDVLGPADTAGLDRSRVRGVLTARGAPTGHAAILARALGIPAVVGAGEAVLRLDETQPVLIDGDTGAVYVQPGKALRREYQERRERAAEEGARAARAAAEPAVTTDGVTVAVEANAGAVSDADAAVARGADGVGLLRTEFLFLDRDTPPGEDEQAETYAAVATRLRGRPLTVRTLDVGADKPAPYLRQPHEDNPFLGVRGLRLGLAHPDLLATQLRAIVRVAAAHPLRVMFPMVTTVAELAAARTLLDRAREETGLAGVSLPVGVMVEVPAVALLADAFAPRVDFFSLGTNDLTQYVLAAERGNAAVVGLGDALHPAVLALIERTARAAERHGCEVAVCGEIAGDPHVAPLLVGLGVRGLSAVPAAVPLVKQAVRATATDAARSLARRALSATSAGDVRALL